MNNATPHGVAYFFVNVCNNSVNDFYFWPGKVLSYWRKFINGLALTERKL